MTALREALYRLLTDDELRARFRANCDQVRRELSWEEPVREQERIYARVVRGWKGEKGKGRMERGKWKGENGEGRMENGEWKGEKMRGRGMPKGKGNR